MSAQCGAMSVLPNDAWAACAALVAGKLHTSPWQRSEQVEELERTLRRGAMGGLLEMMNG